MLLVPRAVAVCVYVNKHGNCGPHLDRKQMQHLPDHFGPGPVNSVLQQVVQSCIDCAYQPKILLSALQTHSGGGEVVRGRLTRAFGSDRAYRRLRTAECLRSFDGPGKLKPSVFGCSENRWWSACGQTTYSLQRVVRASLPGDDVSPPAV